MTSSKPNPEPRLRVLVIDDEKNIRATLSLCLEQIGCQVTAVSSGESALDALTQQAYDLVFLDVRLGDTTGLDLIPKLIAEYESRPRAQLLSWNPLEPRGVRRRFRF